VPHFIEIGDDIVELASGEETAIVNLQQINMVAITKSSHGKYEARVYFQSGQQHVFRGDMAERFLAKLREGSNLANHGGECAGGAPGEGLPGAGAVLPD